VPANQNLAGSKVCFRAGTSSIDEHKPADQNASYHACHRGFHVLREIVLRDAPHFPSSWIFTRMKGEKNHHRWLTESEDFSNSNKCGLHTEELVIFKSPPKILVATATVTSLPRAKISFQNSVVSFYVLLLFCLSRISEFPCYVVFQSCCASSRFWELGIQNYELLRIRGNKMPLTLVRTPSGLLVRQTSPCNETREHSHHPKSRLHSMLRSIY
jgi:hypothetical protein